MPLGNQQTDAPTVIGDQSIRVQRAQE